MYSVYHMYNVYNMYSVHYMYTTCTPHVQCIPHIQWTLHVQCIPHVQCTLHVQCTCTMHVTTFIPNWMVYGLLSKWMVFPSRMTIKTETFKYFLDDKFGHHLCECVYVSCCIRSVFIMFHLDTYLSKRHSSLRSSAEMLYMVR